MGINMGGIGSGWYERYSNRSTTEDYPSVDVRVLAREYRLDEGFILASGISVDLEWRPCNFGGKRVFFECPHCAGICCILYRYEPKGYACKKCLNLIYPVENEGKLGRIYRRYYKAVDRQNYDSSRPGGKPLWMRWPTWRRLSDQVTKAAMERLKCDEKLSELIKQIDRPKLQRKKT